MDVLSEATPHVITAVRVEDDSIKFTLQPPADNEWKAVELMQAAMYDFRIDKPMTTPENELGISPGGTWASSAVTLSRRTTQPHFDADIEQAMLECWGKYMTDEAKTQLREGIDNIRVKHAKWAKGRVAETPRGIHGSGSGHFLG